MVSLEPSLQAEKPQASHLPGEILKSCDRLQSLALDLPGQCLSCVGGPKHAHNAPGGFSQEQNRGINPFPRSGSHDCCDEVQDEVDFLAFELLLTIHIELCVDEHAQILLLTQLPTWPITVLGIALMQDLALGLAEFHEMHIKPLSSLASLPAAWWLTAQPGVTGKRAEGTLDPAVHDANKDVAMCQSQYWHLRNVTGFHLDIKPLTTSLSEAILMIFYTQSGPLFKSMSLHFRDKDVTWYNFFTLYKTIVSKVKLFLSALECFSPKLFHKEIGCPS